MAEDYVEDVVKNIFVQLKKMKINKKLKKLLSELITELDHQKLHCLRTRIKRARYLNLYIDRKVR